MSTILLTVLCLWGALNVALVALRAWNTRNRDTATNTVPITTTRSPKDEDCFTTIEGEY